MKKLLLLPVFLPALWGQMTLVGLTNSACTTNKLCVPWPAMNTTVYRTLGNAVNWNNVNTAQGVYNTANLDSGAQNATQNGITMILFELTNTPTWASSNPTDSNCTAGLGACDPPNDLNADGTGTNQHFKDYATFLMGHALTKWPGTKRVYELWNEPSAGLQQFTGTNAQLVRMQSDAIAIRNTVDPSGLIASSPFSGLWRSSGQTAFTNYLNSGGAVGCDIVGWHGYVQNGTGGNNPTDILTVVLTYMRAQVTAFHLTGRLADTEFSWLQTGNFSGDQVAFVAQSLLVQQQPDVWFENWYSYNISDGILTTASNGGTLSPAGVAFQQVANFWLKPGTTMAAPCTAAGTVWTCKTWTPGNSGPYLVVWDSSGSSTFTLPGTYTSFYGLTSSLPTALSASTVTIGPRPIMMAPGSPKHGWSIFRWFHVN